jgi:hypothetical protein
VAFATLDVSPRGYHGASALWQWPGVVGWARSLQAAGVTADIVVMTLDRGESLVPGVAALYEHMGLRVVEVPPFPIPANQAQGGAWYLPWHKIGVWTLTDYDVVVYMDADMLALQDPSALLAVLDDDGRGGPPAQWGGTAYACGGPPYMEARHVGEWTSGIIVCRPNRTLFAQLGAEAGSRSLWGSDVALAAPGGGDGGFRNDQRFLGEFFLARHPAALPARWVDPYRFHANPMTCRGLRVPPHPSLANFTWAGDVRTTHFGCVPKPWRHGGDGDGCFDDLVRTWRRHFYAAVDAAAADPALPAATRARVAELAKLTGVPRPPPAAAA